MAKKGGKGMGMKKGKSSGRGKKGKGGEKKKKLKPVPEGLKLSEMTKGQLMSFVKRCQAEEDREVEERNLFMLEKNKLWAFWQILIDKVSRLKDEVRNMESRLTKSEKEKESEKEVYNKKLRALQNEEIKNFGFIRLNHLHYMKKISDDIWEIESVLRESSLAKKREIRNTLRGYYEILRCLRLQHAKIVTDMLFAFSNCVHTTAQHHDRKFMYQKNDWEGRNLPIVEEIREIRINKLDRMYLAHDRNVLDMKTFFDDITHNNLSVMSMLHEEVDHQKRNENRLARDLKNAKAHYFSLHDPIQEMLAELKLWAEDAKNEKILISALAKAGKTLQGKLRCEHMLQVSIECIQQQIEMSVEERNRARAEFSKVARKMQRQAQMRSFVYQLSAQAATKDSRLFQAISSQKIRACYNNTRARRSKSPDNFEILRQKRVRRMSAYARAANVHPEESTEMLRIYNAKEYLCVQQGKQVETLSKGKVNSRGVIERPWPVPPSEDDFIQFAKPSIKRTVRPGNIFHNLPEIQVRKRSRRSDTKLVVLPSISPSSSTTNLVSIYSRNRLKDVKSRHFLSEKTLKENQSMSVKEQLDRLLEKADQIASHRQNRDLNCERNLRPPLPSHVGFTVVGGGKSRELPVRRKTLSRCNRKF